MILWPQNWLLPPSPSFCVLGGALLSLPAPPKPKGGPCMSGLELGTAGGRWWGPPGSFKKPTTGSRNQLKVTAGTCGLGSSQQGRRDGGREGGKQPEIKMKSQPGRGAGCWCRAGRREGGGQLSRTCRGLQPWVSPLGLLQPPPQHRALKLPCAPPALSLVPSAAPANGSWVVQAKESPFVPLEPPWECWSRFPPAGLPGHHRRFPAPRGAEQGEAAGWEGCILQLMAWSTPKLLPYYLFKAAAPRVL